MSEKSDRSRSAGRARWRRIVRQWEESGETGVAFCTRRGLNKWTFYEWRRRLRAEARDKTAKETKTRRFVPVKVAGSSEATAPVLSAKRECSCPEPTWAGSGGVEVVLCSGHRVRLERGFDPETLVAAVLVLERVPW